MLAVEAASPERSHDAKTLSMVAAQSLADPFVFVPISRDEAAKGRGATKRIVRAHVTRVQHARSSTTSKGHSLQTWLVKPYLHRDSAVVRRKPRVTRLGEPNLRDTRAENPLQDDRNESSSALARRSWSGPVPRPPFGAATEDPFWSYPVDYQPRLSPIFAHYIQNIAVEIPDLDGPNERGLLRRVWFPLCMTEPSTMYAVLLMAASHYCIVNPAQAVRLDLLALKARALSEINVAMAHPERAITDAVIGAVAKMAAYEAIFGDSTVFAAHMKGLQMLLKLRGGLSTLGLNGLLERMLVWIDLNACHLTGSPTYLGGDEYPTQVSYAAPDPYHFAGIS